MSSEYVVGCAQSLLTEHIGRNGLIRWANVSRRRYQSTRSTRLLLGRSAVTARAREAQAFEYIPQTAELTNYGSAFRFPDMRSIRPRRCSVKLEFHDADTDILSRILARM